MRGILNGKKSAKQGGRYATNTEKRGQKMLNKREDEVMRAVYAQCQENGICLISPAELLALLPKRKKITETQLDAILSALAMDKYFELFSSERKGEKMYVISLRADGYAYPRCSLVERRGLVLKFGWAIASAVIAFLVGVLLKKIF